MCYEFERWNWKSRAKQRDEKAVPTQATESKRDVPKPVKEAAREVKAPEKMPA